MSLRKNVSLQVHVTDGLAVVVEVKGTNDCSSKRICNVLHCAMVPKECVSGWYASGGVDDRINIRKSEHLSAIVDGDREVIGAGAQLT